MRILLTLLLATGLFLSGSAAAETDPDSEINQEQFEQLTRMVEQLPVTFPARTDSSQDLQRQAVSALADSLAKMVKYAKTEVLNLLGANEAVLGDIEQARWYFIRAIINSLREWDRRGFARAEINLAALDEKTGASERALTTYHSMMEVSTTYFLTTELAASSAAIGMIKAERADFDSALFYLDWGLANYRQYGDREGVAITLLQMSRIHRDLGHRQEALDLLQEAKLFAVDLGLQNLLTEIDEQILILDQPAGE